MTKIKGKSFLSNSFVQPLYYSTGVDIGTKIKKGFELNIIDIDP